MTGQTGIFRVEVRHLKRRSYKSGQLIFFKTWLKQGGRPMGVDPLRLSEAGNQIRSMKASFIPSNGNLLRFSGNAVYSGIEHIPERSRI